ncbi:MAG: DUF6311 domain-containing protein [Gemmiger formicilis]|nr:DUF6311 domain-containing protein [Gemmiger formicilis]
MKALKKYRWPLTGALLGVLVFLAVYGVRVLDPTSVDWILNSLSPDPIQHYLGWELFRRSPVHLPYIGANYNAVYPFRTSVLFTDSLPLAALFFKLLGGILPTRFQYFGWWGLLCYALQGGLAQAVIARIAGVQPTFGRDDKSKAAIAIIMSPGQTAKLWGSVLGAGVLVLFPALTIRMFAHTALAANWLVLLALYLWLRSDELMPTTRRACLIWGGMGLLCAGIHLYYLPMVGLVLVGYAVRRALQKRGPAAVLAPIAAFCAAALAELVLLGAFAVNFAGYSNGYLSGADYLGLFVPWLAQSWEQNVYAGVGTSLARGAGGVRHSLQRPQGGKILCRPPRLAHCRRCGAGAGFDCRRRQRHHGERKNAVHRAHPAVFDELLGNVFLLRAAGVVGRYAAGCRWLRVGAALLG